MKVSRVRPQHLCLAFAITLISAVSVVALGRYSLRRVNAAQQLPVLGTKSSYLWGQSTYLFQQGASLAFEAPSKSGWTFDHIEVDLGCGVEGVVGSNVSEIFAIDHGRIQTCIVG